MEQELKIALRDSKTATRPYVLVNPMLAKHMPADPDKVLEYFGKLAGKVAGTCLGERVLVIGFAETATAVGTAVAAAIENAVYVHTTREMMPQDELLAEFQEEHSHAKNQALYLRQEFRELDRYDRVVFVEDEITTGRTILNFLESIRWKGKITVAALVFNGLDERAFSAYDAVFHCLQKTSGEPAGFFEFAAFLNPRSGVRIEQYQECCRNFADQIQRSIDRKEIENQDILVLGTEEFMYPALYLARELAKTAKSVKSHSTTRSPLLPQAEDHYPLNTRNHFASVYDSSRTTYLYNLTQYDTVIIVTDSEKSEDLALLRIVQSYGNQRIYWVRVRNDE